MNSNTSDLVGDRERVCVLVLGDYGRSPRMQYHTLSLVRHGYQVDAVGYKGSSPHEAIRSNQNVDLHLMDQLPDFNKHLPRLLSYVVKVIWQSIILLKVLFLLPKPKYLLVQNPPSIPTLPLAWFYCLCLRVTFVIDWHNYGYTILALTHSKDHILVCLCRWVEKYFGLKAESNFCVSEALQKDLESSFGIKSFVLYDRPAEMFKPISLQEQHHLLSKLQDTYPVFKNKSSLSDTRLTISENGDVRRPKSRPFLLISSTSWTDDEDFSLLLDALEEYEMEAKNESNNLPTIICIITGKGPNKAYYEELIKNLDFKMVEFVLPWLEAEDYPKLLAACDLGVCLHTSSSSLDLPMKIIDMFGCCVPVCAIGYPCLTELVKPGVNGLLFYNSQELVIHLKNLLHGFPTESTKLNKLKKNLIDTADTFNWESCWIENALPIFKK